MFDRLLYSSFLLLVTSLRVAPRFVALACVSILVRLAFLLRPKYRSICFKNLALAFPHDPRKQEQVYARSFSEVARLAVDLCHLPDADAEWCKQHIDSSECEKYFGVRARHPEKGILLVSGHLGSFELLGHCYFAFMRPIAVVMRKMSSPRITQWWIRMRAVSGNSVVDRAGGLRAIIRTLREGKDVAILFDQNVTRGNAVFVPLFGRVAATTAAVGAAAIATDCPVMVCTIINLPDWRYRIRFEEVDIEDLKANQALSRSEKILKITERVTSIFEKRVLEFPEGWFWMHRRWRTTERPEDENFYNSRSES